MREYAISMDEFTHPVIYEDKKALFVLLVRIILLEPGTYQTNPNMGVGIISRYRYSMEVDLGRLKADIETQISEYIPNLSSISVELEPDYNSNLLYIRAYLDKYLYELTFNTTTLELKSL